MKQILSLLALSAIMNRRSIRRYEDKAVPRVCRSAFS